MKNFKAALTELSVKFKALLSTTGQLYRSHTHAAGPGFRDTGMRAKTFLVYIPEQMDHGY